MTAPASPPTPPSGGVSTQTLLACGCFFSGAALRICDSLLPRLARDFSMTTGAASQVIIAFAVAYGLAQLLFGPLGDRYGKARMVCLALFGCAAGAAASVVAPTFGFLLATRMVWGVAAAGVVPLSMAWIGDMVPYEERQTTLAKLLMGILGGMTAGQLAGGLFADSALGWRGAFGVLTIGYVAVGIVLFLRVRSQPPAAVSSHAALPFKTQLASVIRAPWSRVVLVAVFLEGMFLLGPLAFLPTFLHQDFGISLSVASAAIALYAVGGLVYAMTARRIVQRLGERRMVAWGGVLMGMGFAAWWLSPWWQTAAPVALMVGFGTYLFHNTLQTHATQMAPRARGTAVSLFAFGLFTGQAGGVALGGWVFDRAGILPLLVVPAVVLPLTGWWFARALKRRAQD
ncbi:MAG: MFS transporter [Pseudomonadota bacterium]